MLRTRWDVGRDGTGRELTSIHEHAKLSVKGELPDFLNDFRIQARDDVQGDVVDASGGGYQVRGPRSLPKYRSEGPLQASEGPLEVIRSIEVRGPSKHRLE